MCFATENREGKRKNRQQSVSGSLYSLQKCLLGFEAESMITPHCPPISHPRRSHNTHREVRHSFSKVQLFLLQHWVITSLFLLPSTALSSSLSSSPSFQEHPLWSRLSLSTHRCVHRQRHLPGATCSPPKLSKHISLMPGSAGCVACSLQLQL